MGTCGPVEAHTGAFDTLVFYQAVYCSHIVCNVLYQYCKGLGHLGVDAKRIESVVRGSSWGRIRRVWFGPRNSLRRFGRLCRRAVQ